MRHVRDLAAFSAALGLLLFATPASAAPSNVYNVNTTKDGNLAVQGSTVCASNPDQPSAGKCSLRAAVQAANNNDGGSVKINVPAGVYKFSVPNPSQRQFASDPSFELLINSPSKVTIIGAGASKTIVDADYKDRVFEIASGSTASISKLTIENGRPGGLAKVFKCPAGSPSSGSGGGILDTGELTLSGDRVTGNLTVGDGGGIEDNSPSTDTLSVLSSKVDGNVACSPSQAPPYGDGGGIDESHSGTVKVLSSIISGNKAGLDGGGVEEAGGPYTDVGGHLTITDSTISGNSAPTSDGGGVAGEGPPFSQQNMGVIRLFGDAIFGNKAASGGGVASYDSTTIINTTVADNTSTGRSLGGGGLAVFGPFRVSFSTIADNTAKGGGAGNIDGSSDAGGGITLDDTIVARGHGPTHNCGNQIFYTDNGYNLFDDVADKGAQCGSNGSQHDVIAANPKLDHLANNGGATLTEALLTGSPALDAANGRNCQTETKNSSGIAVDQREVVTRPQGPACDIGAFEATPDLHVSGSAQNNPILIGQQDTVNYVIGNGGPEPALDSTFTDPGAGYRIDSVSTSQGSCTHTAQTLKCDFGTIAKGGSVKVTVVLTALAAGQITLHGFTHMKNFDASPGNNHVTVAIRVLQPGAPTISIGPLSSACYAESSTIRIHATAHAGAGIRNVSLAVHGGSFNKNVGVSPPPSKVVKQHTIALKLGGSTLLAGRSYSVTGRVVDKLGHTAHDHATFTMCKTHRKRGFTG